MLSSAPLGFPVRLAPHDLFLAVAGPSGPRAMVLAAVSVLAAILRAPFAILTPLIAAVGALGAYSVHGSTIDVWYMLILGVIGHVFENLDYPLVPLALVLGDLAESGLRQSPIMSQGILVSRPIAGTIVAVAIAFLALPVITPWGRRMRGGTGTAPLLH